MPPIQNIEIQEGSVSKDVKAKSKGFKIILIILAILLCAVSLLVWYGFYLEKQDQNLLNNYQGNNMDVLSVEKIKGFEVAKNVGNDYFIGSPDEQSSIVDEFVNDNSMSDSVYLYIAANTAQIINRPKEAMFLFFSAQLRKRLDIKRFGLGDADGDNVQTYLGYLNEGAGQAINPLAVQNPKLYSEAIRMIEKWDIIPADNANYPIESYGTVKMSKDQIQEVSKGTKESFLNDFAYKQEKALDDPKVLAAMVFLQDYNFGKIPHSSENDKKYQEYRKVVGDFYNK